MRAVVDAVLVWQLVLPMAEKMKDTLKIFIDRNKIRYRKEKQAFNYLKYTV